MAVRVGERTLLRRLTGRAHASDLLPCLAEALDTLGATPHEIELVVVGTGPGSYTGLRVGSATALGLARGCAAALVGVPSVAALALERLRPGERGVVLLDARGGAFYHALYARENGRLRTLAAPRALVAEEVARSIPAGALVLCDPAAVERVLPGIGADRLRPGIVPAADALLVLGLQRFTERGPDAPGAVKPLYLRPFGSPRGARDAR